MCVDLAAAALEGAHATYSTMLEDLNAELEASVQHERSLAAVQAEEEAERRAALAAQEAGREEVWAARSEWHAQAAAAAEAEAARLSDRAAPVGGGGRWGGYNGGVGQKMPCFVGLVSASVFFF